MAAAIIKKNLRGWATPSAGFPLRRNRDIFVNPFWQLMNLLIKDWT